MGPNNHNNYWIKEMNNYPADEEGDEGGQGMDGNTIPFFLNNKQYNNNEGGTGT